MHMLYLAAAYWPSHLTAVSLRQPLWGFFFSPRARFELLCAPIFNKCIQPIRPLLDEVRLTTGDINKVWNCKRNVGTTHHKATDSVSVVKVIASSYNDVAVLPQLQQRNRDAQYLLATTRRLKVSDADSMLDPQTPGVPRCPQVVLCGGSAKIPRLQAMIQDIFPDVDILSSTPPDEVIAVGAALQAGLLVSRDGPALEQESTTVEVSASDILVKVGRCRSRK